MTGATWEVELLLPGSWRGATSVLLLNGRHSVVVDTGLPHEAPQLIKALADRGLQPTDIGTVINTHFHLDHVLNNSLFPRSTIYASQESYEWCCSLYSDVRLDAGWEKRVLRYYPETHDYEASARYMQQLRKLALRWWDVKRLGPPSQFQWLEAHTLPEGLESLITWGHVPGHVSVIVGRAGTPAVITGDALLSRGDDAQVLTMIPHNRRQYQLDRARILALEGYILPGHDQGFVTQEKACGREALPQPSEIDGSPS